MASLKWTFSHKKKKKSLFQEGRHTSPWVMIAETSLGSGDKKGRCMLSTVLQLTLKLFFTCYHLNSLWDVFGIEFFLC